MSLTRDEIDRIVIRGLHLRHPDPVSEELIARHFRIDQEEVHSSLLRLRRKRLARDRTRKGERVWGPW